MSQLPFANLVESFLSHYAPRWVNRWYAKSNHYFWLPCPMCNREFAGYEWAGTLLDESLNGGLGVCSKCVDLAMTMNELCIARNNQTPDML